MTEKLNWDEATVLPAPIIRIKTNTDGGWQVVIDAPEIAGAQIKQLIGTENKFVYAVGFLKAGEIEQKPKRGPGRPAEPDKATE